MFKDNIYLTGRLLKPWCTRIYEGLLKTEHESNCQTKNWDELPQGNFSSRFL